MNHQRAGWKVVALTITALAVGTSHADHWTGHYVDANDFSVEVPGMLDFDQIREASPPDVEGLPGNGEMYCVPTASMDLLAFLATHGYPGLDPGVADWDDHDDPELYGTITDAIADLGDMMGTSVERGTNFDPFHEGLIEWLATRDAGGHPLRSLVVESYSASPEFGTTVDRAAWLATSGVVILCYGYYPDATYVYGHHGGTTSASGTLGVRDGGHCVAFYSAQRTTPIETDLRVMDPIEASPGDDRFSQSVMSPTDRTTDDVEFTDESIICSAMRGRTAGGELRVIDEIHVIRPIWVLTRGYAPGVITVRSIGAFGGGDSSKDIVVPGNVVDASLRSDQSFLAAVTRESLASPGDAWLLDVQTGKTAHLARSITLRIAFSRFQELYIADGRRVSRLGIDSGVPHEKASTVLSIAPRGLEWVDGVDELWALDGAAGRVLAMQRGLTGRPRVIHGDPTFMRLAADPDVRMSAVPGGGIVLLSPAAGVVAVFQETSQGLVVRSRYGGVRQAKDVSSTEHDRIVVTSENGFLLELEDDGAGRLLPTSDGLFTGIVSTGVVEAARHRTNFDRARQESSRFNGGR